MPPNRSTHQRTISRDEAPSPHAAARPPQKGRGTVWAIEHRYSRTASESYDDGWGTLDQEASEELVAPETTIIEERVKSVLSGNDSPDLSFDLSINPYRGCEHGCVYCFARPTHSYLNMSPGLDFETRIIAKVNAAERLREAFASRAYEATSLNLGSATDAYQPVERKLGITRAIIEVLAECRHPFSLVTKSSGVERDLDLIGADGRAWPGGGLRLRDLARSGIGAHPGAARRGAASTPEDHRSPGQGGCSRRGECLADDSVHQRTGDRAHPRSGGGGRRELGVRHRPAPALGSESDLPALARPALSRSRRPRHGAHPRDARRPRLQRPISAAA